MNTKKQLQNQLLRKTMILANQILNSIENISFSNDQSFKSKITKFDGKIVECDSFPSPIGTVCKLFCNDGNYVTGEIIGFREKRKFNCYP